MKKLLALLLCVLLIATSSVVAFAETTVDATITVATVNGPFAEGDEIAIPITITEWANAYGGFNLEVLCESKALEFDRLENSTVDFSGALSTIYENKLSLIASPSSDRQAQKVDGGEICVAYFYSLVNDLENTTVTVTATVKGYTNGKNDGWVANRQLLTNVIAGGVDDGTGCGGIIGGPELGDVDGDGFVNAVDAMLICQYYVGLDVVINIDLADVSGEGDINAVDAMLISQYYVGLIDKFPAEN